MRTELDPFGDHLYLSAAVSMQKLRHYALHKSIFARVASVKAIAGVTPCFLTFM